MSIYNIYIEREIKRANRLRRDSKILVLGDSHTGAAINDRLTPIFENRSANSESYYFSYHKLKAFIESNSSNNIDAVSLIYTFHSYNRRIDSLFMRDNNRWLYHYSPIYRASKENLPTKFNLPIKGRENSLRFRSYIYSDKLSVKDIRAAYRGNFMGNDKLIKDAPQYYLDEIIKSQFQGVSNLESYISPSQIDILCRIAEYSKEHNIQLFLVCIPLHHDYNQRILSNLAEYHISLAEKLHNDYGTIYLDYHTMALPDSCFKDHNHLNIHGANIFTPLLLEDITAEMERLGRW